MERDRRYELVKDMFKLGRVKKFKDIFEYIPKTAVANDLGLNKTRFSDHIEKVENFRVKDLLLLAGLLDLRPQELAELIFNQYDLNRNKVKKR